MDFWLSFMAVVSTFVYLTTIDEVHKRTIHTAVAILTAIMAITKATRYAKLCTQFSYFQLIPELIYYVNCAGQQILSL